jgi:hypothetical protein
MKVLLVHEDNHGVIGVAKDIDSAVSFLITDGWLHEETDICHDNGSGWVWEPIKEVYSKDWEHFLRCLTVEQFNEIWEDCFYLKEVEIFGTP